MCRGPRIEQRQNLNAPSFREQVSIAPKETPGNQVTMVGKGTLSLLEQGLSVAFVVGWRPYPILGLQHQTKTRVDLHLRSAFHDYEVFLYT